MRSRSKEERSRNGQKEVPKLETCVEERSRNGIKELPKLDTMGTAATVEVQALNKPTNTRTAIGVRRMEMSVFLGGRLSLSDPDGIQCQVGYVVGFR
jgi:hypothetical protein